ncbi:hypothetical protein [Sphingobacterium sp. UBA5670]|uniref:hypothetical protein n=1 Tax=Sphingobacterium sp. UBA5670 TaxID=1947502 RepID=UPI0025E94033|nr:hypothetical protein [Sphingobacterium sp. UBA5670]
MNRKKLAQDQHQGMPIIAFAIVSQQDPNDRPNDVSNDPDEDFLENESDEDPEMPDQDDLGIHEETGNEEEGRLDDDEIAEQEEANDAEGLPVQPPTAPSDLDETTI